MNYFQMATLEGILRLLEKEGLPGLKELSIISRLLLEGIQTFAFGRFISIMNDYGPEQLFIPSRPVYFLISVKPSAFP